MQDWTEVAQSINRFVKPLTIPVGIKLVPSADDFPAKTRRPASDLGFQTTICVAIAMARKYGWTIGLTPEDNYCPVAEMFYGWSEEPARNEFALFSFLKSLNYGVDDEALRQVLSSTTQYRLEPGRCGGVVVSPVESGRMDPDLIMMFCNSAQLMRLVHAATRETGEELASVFTGRFGSCNEGILRTLKTQKPQVVVPGNGDRVWGMVQDDEMIFTIPANAIQRVVESLEATHKAGVRFPIPVDVRHEPNFPPQLTNAMKEWKP